MHLAPLHCPAVDCKSVGGMQQPPGRAQQGGPARGLGRSPSWMQPGQPLSPAALWSTSAPARGVRSFTPAMRCLCCRRCCCWCRQPYHGVLDLAEQPAGLPLLPGPHKQRQHLRRDAPRLPIQRHQQAAVLRLRGHRLPRWATGWWGWGRAGRVGRDAASNGSGAVRPLRARRVQARCGQFACMHFCSMPCTRRAGQQLPADAAAPMPLPSE